ncbi:MAG: hypothetical protein SFY96_12990 [Planctomycetota bacterium]|nr:hypothetical protein [Planctomycetota bacterium]
MCQVANWMLVDPGTLFLGASPAPGVIGLDLFDPRENDPRLSGAHWVTWANANAVNRSDLDSLSKGFRPKLDKFLAALKDAGAKVKVSAAYRHPHRAYLFHWSWLVGLGKVKPKAALAIPGVDIIWDHGDDARSRAAAMEMVRGFGLAVPPRSKVAPALSSNHTRGDAVDMDITWTGTLKIKDANGTEYKLSEPRTGAENTELHKVGETYGVKKLVTDAPHWSLNGR